ncbi:LRR receptor-like serine/threonine-protein kinase EFR [Linum perenne]
MIANDPLRVLSSWNDSIHFCEWYGVSCSRRHRGKVSALLLPYQELSGSVSPHIGNLSFLKVLNLSNNMFVGEIPSEIGGLRRLQRLDLYNNSLEGEIPPNISGCSALTVFDVTRNKLMFTLHQNQMSGEVPDALDQLKSLQLLVLSFNNLYGEIPASIFNISSLIQIWFGANQFHGSLPWNLGTSLPNLEKFDVFNNNLIGRLPPSLSNASNLDFGNLSTNLLRLTINDNKISGNFPSGIQNFIKLEVLWAENNQMSGGEIPASIENLKSLQLLNISHNNLRGVIPPQVMGLTSLSLSLDLSHNRFTGSLPVEVENLRNLGSLDLSHNMLSGSIPGSLGSCVMLESLHLQGNFLEGFIPSSLSSIRGIRELDLSANNLSGQIPFFLENMNISKLLNLSYNNFDGEMFEEGVFKNASIVSVIGNSKLCGGIPEFKLPPCKKFRNKSLSRKWKIVISTVSSLLFLAFIGVSFFVFRVKRRGKQAVDSVDDPQLQQLSYQRLYKATDGFSAANQVGVGSFGSVYKGVLDENSLVTNIAVKVFNLQRRGASKSFMAECEALKNIRHKNLVKILTVCSSVDSKGNDFKALIYEFLANGSLEDWLHRPVGRIDEPPKSLNFLQRVNIVIDIASAMDYLHNNCGTPIVHCDIKPSNILLDEDIVAHVGDFGLARFISPIADPSLSSIGIKGTVGYAPPV